MRPTSKVSTLALLGLVGAAALSARSLEAQDAEQGRAVYDQWCSQCHGAEGNGQGPAANHMLPRPRDFTRGLFQIRTTAGGELPTDADILRVIDLGMPGTTMPGWRDLLSQSDREAVAAYVKTFYPQFETFGAPTPLEFSSAPGVSEEALAEGRMFYDSIECWQCHGEAGRGDGRGAPELEDEWEQPIRAADLTSAWRMNGGGTVEDIYRALRTGIDGTPMPQFSDLLDAGFMTDAQLWNLAHYVRSLSPEEPPAVREVIRVARAEAGTGVPTQVSDERWNSAEAFYVPLVGQIITGDRAFDPAVTSVWVQGIHDGNELAIRVSWTDRSRSPDAAWQELFQPRVIAALEPFDSARVPGPRPDRLVVQFPTEIPEGMERPYFLFGDSRDPVHLWQWQSDQAGVQRATGRGIRDIQTTDAGGVTTDAQWADGQWQVVFRRPFQPTAESGEIAFASGRPIPIALFAWDGDSGEDGTRGAISTWYFLFLEEEIPPSTYIAPIIAFLLTGGLGLFAVARAQRRERQGLAHGAPATATASGS